MHGKIHLFIAYEAILGTFYFFGLKRLYIFSRVISARTRMVHQNGAPKWRPVKQHINKNDENNHIDNISVKEAFHEQMLTRVQSSCANKGRYLIRHTYAFPHTVFVLSSRDVTVPGLEPKPRVPIAPRV